MREIIGRFVRLCVKLKLFKVVTKVTYTGKGVSLNQFYSQGHWSARSNTKKKYRKIFDKLLENNKRMRWMNKFSLIIFYNSRHDLDNVVGMGKVFIDCLKREVDREGNVTREGFVYDDSKRYYKGLGIFPDEKLPINTFEFILIDND